MPSSIDDVARPATAIAANGSPSTALGYQSDVNPAASASTACSMIRSMVGAPAPSPILIGRMISRAVGGAVTSTTERANKQKLAFLPCSAPLRPRTFHPQC